ncbi:hypothetical protein [Streptacidiphilus cavernicola]|uniref:Right handed beta helix domain-containing protein n=1 Tax=Streptacidiphilus cavernicola TaxID=3342716 RepID=A0ABV6W0U1_9ACTN
MLRARGRILATGILLALVLVTLAVALSRGGGPERTTAGPPGPSADGSAGTSSVQGTPSPAPGSDPAKIGQPASTPSPRPSTGKPAGSGKGSSVSGDATGQIVAGGFPDASSTGPRIALKPHHTGALSITTNGTVISGWDITGSLDIYANNVTIVDSRVTSDNWWGINLRAGFSGLRILHTTITGLPGQGPDNGGEDYAVSNMGGSSIEVGWSNISEFGNMLSMGQGNLHDNYLHDVSEFRNQSGGWEHADAVISDGGNTGSLIIRHNTLLNQVGVDHGASGSIGLFADTGTVANSVVDGNWIAGGSYALYGGGPGATGIQVTNNIFSTQFHPDCGEYGPVAAWNAGGAGNVWSNNKMSDGRTVVPSS